MNLLVMSLFNICLLYPTVNSLVSVTSHSSCLSLEMSPVLGSPDCRAEAAVATHLCDGSLNGHGMNPCHGWIATILEAWCWGEVNTVISGSGGSVWLNIAKEPFIGWGPDSHQTTSQCPAQSKGFTHPLILQG